MGRGRLPDIPRTVDAGSELLQKHRSYDEHVPLGSQRVGAARGQVTAFFNGRPFEGNPRRIPLLAHAQIQLDVGRPLVAHESIRFPNGL